jgi:predicted flavoprotein YhiN
LFSKTNNAKDILKVFVNLCREFNQDILCNVNVKTIIKLDDGMFQIIIEQEGKESTLNVPKVVIASRGLSVKKMEQLILG